MHAMKAVSCPSMQDWFAQQLQTTNPGVKPFPAKRERYLVGSLKELNAR